MKVLIVEDDPTLMRNICEALTADGAYPTSVYDGLLAEKILKRENFDCVVLDINLPGMNGYTLCQNFRTFDTTTPVLMLTAFSELEDKIKGFDCGADDYLTKPFFMRELIIRINALSKRAGLAPTAQTEKALLIVGDISINTLSKTVSRQGNEINLTPREY